jgi:calpain-12
MEGIFETMLWHKGNYQKVVVDDRLPMYRMPSTPISAQMNLNGGWWAPILEKAYAKMHQNYVRLSGGLSFESLRTLTGMPVIPHFPMYFPQKYDENTLW